MLVGVISLDIQRGMGYRGKLLISLKADMTWFRRLTTEHDIGEPLPAVVMGRKTWDSLPLKYRPLPGRRNFVLTRHHTISNKEKVIFGSDWNALLNQAQNVNGDRTARVFVIGGAEVFRLALPDIDILYVTEFHQKFLADTFFPPFRKDFPNRKVLEKGEENGISYEIVKYTRKTNFDGSY